jgi:hypothetical protein
LPGGTNLILLDASGDEIFRTSLQIGSRQTHVVVFGGVKAQNYSCAPSCVTTPSSTPLGTTAPLAAGPAEATAVGRATPSAGAPTEVGGPE